MENVVVLFRENPDTVIVTEIRQLSCRDFTCQCLELARLQTRSAEGASVFDPPRLFVYAFQRFIRARSHAQAAGVTFFKINPDGHVTLRGGFPSREAPLPTLRPLKQETH